ncbi:MAG: radical SAM protein, partial [Candidatus Bathyarchaeia archaeon]
AGCNLRCRSCQNYSVTYDNYSEPLTPEEAARRLTYYKRLYGVNGLAISGGEPTMNKRWLLKYFRELRRLNPDKKARLHLDSNGTLLTPSYIDALIEAGANNIGVEPKGLRLETFMNISGIRDESLAERYLKTSWEAVKYLADKYKDRVYIGVGVPYNSAFMTFDELFEIGEKIDSIDPTLQVCVLDYFPAFRRREIKRPSYREMLKVKEILNSVGLKYVIVQTSIGHVGP